MRFLSGKKRTGEAAGFLSRLAHDRAGNTAMIVAFSLVPILAMVGGGIDMGRGYLSQSRLQQACDSGVLAARKKLGQTVSVSSTPTSDVKAEGDKFFNLNFRTGSYGTSSRTFAMTVESDSAISGTASVSVPTTLMGLFGYNKIPVNVTCQAKINFSNTDVMMVLDTTGSMTETNPSDTKPKIEILRDTVKAFYAQLESAKGPGTRIRYGFVPYSTNVNVGFLLKSSWLVDNWTYQGREPHDTGTTAEYDDWDQQWIYISGTFAYGTPYYGSTCPPYGVVDVLIDHGIDSDGYEYWTRRYNGSGYYCESQADGLLKITPYTYTNYTETYRQKNKGKKTFANWDWYYKPVTLDVSSLKSGNPNNPPTGGKIRVDMGGYPEPGNHSMDAWFNGCIEERQTYEITDYSNVDLTRALDLDLDLVPTSGQPATQWRPQLPDIAWARALTWSNWNTWPWQPGGAYLDGDFIHSGWNGYAACPAQSRKLAEMTSAEVSTYVDALTAAGSTYHDIGMIWGGRLLSSTGLFAAENADVSGHPTSRHLIFLTDGLTQPLELSYSSYGIEPLVTSNPRWTPSSALTLTQVVENRLGVACSEVKKKNITVWVIGFGTSLNSTLTTCAGPGHYFTAANASSLAAVFAQIAASMGDLRVSQ